MTNYIIKYDINQYQLILTAVILKYIIKDAKFTINFSKRQLRIRC